MSKISIIGVPMDLGADRRGVDMGPSALRYADLNTPETAPSGNVHGMPMAAIMGYGPRSLTHIFDFSPKVQPANAVMVGIRDVDAEEREMVKKSGVRVFTMKEIDRRGIGTVLEEALS